MLPFEFLVWLNWQCYKAWQDEPAIRWVQNIQRRV